MGVFYSFGRAVSVQEECFSKKTSKGYLDIDCFPYASSVPKGSFATRITLATHLEKELDHNGNYADGTHVKVKCANPKCNNGAEDGQILCKKCFDESSNVEPDELICTDNTGCSEQFDVGISYVVEKHTVKDMLWAYDKNGIKTAIFRTRFMKSK